MRRLVRTPTLQWSFTCDECGKEIRNLNDLLLLRCSDALPEEVTYFVHCRCAPTFVEHHPDRWDLIPSTSVDAGWLL